MLGKQKFPDLYKGGQYMVGDIAKQQAGMLGGNIAADMAKSGLGPVNEGRPVPAISRYRPLSYYPFTENLTGRNPTDCPEPRVDQPDHRWHTGHHDS